MGCNCKTDEKGDEIKEPQENKIFNNFVKVIIFLFGAVIIPFTIPILWYFLFKQMFFEHKTLDFIPMFKWVGNKIFRMGIKDEEEEEYDGDLDFDPDELELVTKIEEIGK